MLRSLFFFLIGVFVFMSCKSRKADADPNTLPKDIALMPERDSPRIVEAEKLKNQRMEIDSLVNTVSCTDASQWKIVPIGSKACGEPLEYMAYPLEIESELIPKVIGYTENMSAFNKKFNVVSDCEMTPYPTGIVCENGKAVLTRQTEEE